MHQAASAGPFYIICMFPKTFYDLYEEVLAFNIFYIRAYIEISDEINKEYRYRYTAMYMQIVVYVMWTIISSVSTYFH